MTPLRLTRPQAQRIALAAQGFADPVPQPWAATTRHLQRVVDRVGVVQLDSVNVLTRSHYLPFHSRLGPYDAALLDRARDAAPRRLVEYWAHEASLVPPSTWPLLGFRMRRAGQESWSGMQAVARDHPGLVAAVREVVARRGPLTSRQCEQALEHVEDRGTGHWGWNWSMVKAALEHLFWAGEISSAGRTAQFERRYALPQRVLPPALAAQAVDPQARPGEAEACVELVRIAARAHGIGTELCLRDYFRLKVSQARPAIEQLVAAGELVPARVEGWDRPVYLHARARRPRRVEAQALLSPFDSLVWQRRRTHELFGFHLRLSLYTPAAQRTDGYYVLPYLHGQDLVGRVDLKADRRAGVLRAGRPRFEPHAPPGAAEGLRGRLRAMADWLGLDDVVVADD